jgi:hypothetical protein
MGQLIAKAETSYDISGIELLAQCRSFTVQRTSGDWDLGHTFCTDPSSWSAMIGDPEEIKKFKGPVAAKRMYSSRFPFEEQEVDNPPWRILLKLGDVEDPKSIHAWRQLDKIRPTGMEEVYAVEWRKAVKEALDAM